MSTSALARTEADGHQDGDDEVEAARVGVMIYIILYYIILYIYFIIYARGTEADGHEDCGDEVEAADVLPQRVLPPQTSR